MFCLPNQSTTEVNENDPWKFKPAPAAEAMRKRNSKDAWREWSQRPTTKHLFFSAFEGLNPHLRISETNPPRLLHGIVADYDADISDAMLKEVDYSNSVAPWAVSKTFSGGRRLVWLFERPLLLHSVTLTKRFLERACKELRLDSLLPGLDKQALVHPAKYYECGTNWTVAKKGHDQISTAAVNLWMMEASQKYDWSGEGTNIPMDLLAAELEKKFPGRWDGDFVLGARGRRFWDPEADNPTAAIVRDTGMQCFTGGEPFVPWHAIFGPKFVRKFEEDHLGGAVDGIHYDGKDYWMQLPNNNWVSYNQLSLARHLRVKRGLNGDRGKKDNHSEVEKALCMIEDHQRIAGALPFVHQPEGIITRTGRRYLNTSTSVVIQPCEGRRKWGQDFPWLAEFLDTYFTSREAQECFLAWLQRFYTSALARELKAGQAIFLAGDVSQGKSLMTNVVIGELMGGHQDAASYLLGETQFNKELFEACLWTIDDAIASSDLGKRARYTAMVKKMIANRVFEYHAKFRDAMSVPWIGRVAVTLNKDVESAMILPDMETNTLDKISLFLVRTVKDRPFPKNPTEHIKSELPYFARWLMDWKAPEHVTSGPHAGVRYGVRSYHEPELLTMAKEANDGSQFSEMLDIWRHNYFHHNEVNFWKGSATELFASCAQVDGLREVTRSSSPVKVGRGLAKLHAQGAPYIKIGREGGGGGRIWTIARPKKLRPIQVRDEEAEDR